MLDEAKGSKIRSIVDTEGGDCISNFRGGSQVGVSIKLPDCRPIDVMFILGTTVTKWKQRQREARDRDPRRGVSPDYSYAILYDSSAKE